MEILKAPLSFYLDTIELRFAIDPNGHRVLDVSELWNVLQLGQFPLPKSEAYFYETTRLGCDGWGVSRFCTIETLVDYRKNLAEGVLKRMGKMLIDPLDFVVQYLPKICAKLDADLKNR